MDIAMYAFENGPFSTAINGCIAAPLDDHATTTRRAGSTGSVFSTSASTARTYSSVVYCMPGIFESDVGQTTFCSGVHLTLVISTPAQSSGRCASSEPSTHGRNSREPSPPGSTTTSPFLPPPLAGFFGAMTKNRLFGIDASVRSTAVDFCAVRPVANVASTKTHAERRVLIGTMLARRGPSHIVPAPDGVPRTLLQLAATPVARHRGRPQAARARAGVHRDHAVRPREVRDRQGERL